MARCSCHLAHARSVATSVGKPQMPFDRVFICLRGFKKPLTIENPADCEVHAVICFLCVKGLKAIDIHRQISEVYGENIMNEGMLRTWVRAFKDGSTNVHNEEQSGRPSVITDYVIQKVDCKVKDRRLKFNIP
ncbi:hypothetical protein J6590_001667 [Homalodisca vitripennis]|nr:hypothetical protein J6590_001667 [Homalodisca vitripennis]